MPHVELVSRRRASAPAGEATLVSGKPRVPMTDSPMTLLAGAVRQNGLVRFLDRFARLYPHAHLKDLVVERVGPHRHIVVQGRHVINFGSDSFLGLDEDPRVQEAIRRGVERWGTHNGASRAFSCVRANEEAEEKLA